MAHLAEVSDASFDAEVLQAAGPVLVDFWAEWCGPCRMMAPVLEKLAEEHSETLRIVKLDVQASPSLAQRYTVTSIPSLLLFVGGELKERLVGYVPAPKVMEKVTPYLG